MSQYQKLALAALVAVSVLGLGYLLSQPGNVTFQTDSGPESSVETPDDFDDGWSLNPFSPTDSGEKPDEETTKPDEPTRVDSAGLGSFTLKGKVDFPNGVTGETVSLRLQVRELNLDSEQYESLMKTLPSKGSQTPSRMIVQKVADQLGSDVLSGESQFHSLTTDPAGTFKLEDAPPGLYTVNITSEKWNGQTEIPSVQLPGRAQVIRVEARHKATFGGRVVSPAGNPVSGASVSVGPERSTRTDNKGNFHFDRLTPGGPLQVKVTKSGSIPLNLTLDPLESGEKRHREFTLESGVDLTVRLRTPDGEPITQGRVGIARADTRTKRGQGEFQGLPANDVGAVSHTKTKPPDRKGNVTFKGLHPGRVSLKFIAAPARRDDTSVPPLLSDRKSVEITQGGAQDVTLTAYRGKKYWINIVDATTGQTLKSQTPSDVTVYRDGKPLDPGIRPTTNSSKPFSGLVNPNADKIEVTVTPVGATMPGKNQNYRPASEVFTLSDLPELVVEMEPTEGRPRGAGQSGGMDIRLTEPFSTATGSWPSGTRARIYVIDGQTGRILASRGGSSNPFNTPLRVPSGEHFVYGTVRYEGSSYAFFRRAQVLQEKISTLSIRAERSSTLNITVDDDQSDGKHSYELEVVPNELMESTGGQFVLPEPLTIRGASSEDLTLTEIPSGTSLTLRLRLMDDGPGTSGRILEERPLSGLGSGESRTVAVDG